MGSALNLTNISKKLFFSLLILIVISRLITTQNCYPINNTGSGIVQSTMKNNFQHSVGDIKTVKIHKTGWELSDPIIELNSNETVSLSFDDLSDVASSYSYTIIHCNKDWLPSNLSIFDYFDGFEFNAIDASESSMATTIPYTHYKIEVPNDNVKLKISGNYLIRIVDTYNYSNIIFEVKFMVVEPLARINAAVTQPFLAGKRTTSQQLNLNISATAIKTNDPVKELFVNVYQNNQPDNAKIDIQPLFFQGNELNYSSPDALIFDGVNEYRSFDIKSIRYNSPEIDNIMLSVNEFQVMLKPDENNRVTKYTYNPDINGRNLVKLEGSNQSETEADYVWVYFTIPYPEELMGKEVYVYGELSDWTCKPDEMMRYNNQRKGYELRMLIKQGYYNYRYVVKDSKTGTIDHTFFEGNHFDTENTYLILVYLKQMESKYDRLVGVKRISSRNVL